ncbi:MAG: hypothetical protein ACRERD_24865 [Candidatus Binatia bacterium]
MAIKKECTLLELVQSVGEFALSDDEVVATVSYLINSGRVRLCGNFAGAKVALRPSIDILSRWVRNSQATLAV